MSELHSIGIRLTSSEYALWTTVKEHPSNNRVQNARIFTDCVRAWLAANTTASVTPIRSAVPGRPVKAPMSEVDKARLMALAKKTDDGTITAAERVEFDRLQVVL